jgi:F-type H+-transporting ATPase subunit gamma
VKKFLIYKKEMEGFRGVREAVKVVEKAAAAHIHFLRKRVRALSDYESAIEKEMNRLLEFLPTQDYFLLTKREAGRRALLIVGGDKGIVGGMHHDLINQFLLKKNFYQKIFVLGRKIKEYLDEEKVDSEILFGKRNVNLPEFEEINEIGSKLFIHFQKNDFRSIDILYPRFISFGKQQAVFARFLPFEFFSKSFKPNKVMVRKEQFSQAAGWPIFEPSKKLIFEALLKKYIEIFFVKIVLEAKLSEFSARTIASEHAASKTSEIIKSRQLAFLKERRLSLSQKQLESFIAHSVVSK